MTRILSLLSLLAVGLCLLPGCGKKPDNRLVVGMELAYPPFEKTDEHGNPAGVSVDLARALGQFLGRPVEIQNTRFDGLIPSLQTQKIDLIISSMTVTPERSKAMAFSDPYLKTGLCLLVGKNSAIQSINDADQTGNVLVVKLGTTGQIYADGHVKKAQVRVLDKADACVLEVIEGKAGAFLYDQISTYANWQRNPATTRAILQPFQEESWAVGLRLDDTAMRDQVNAFLRDFKQRGGFDQLGDRWLKDQKEAFRKLGYPFYF
jgi:polar amino acid transport system substrate-binding protein